MNCWFIILDICPMIGDAIFKATLVLGVGFGRTSVIVAQDINHGRDDKYCVLIPGEDGNTYNIMCYN